MGQITVEKNVGGIEGLCVITPAVQKQELILPSFRTISPCPQKAF